MQGFNKYYPPDYDPEKTSSLNAYRGKHALGDRARKLDQGILITRFELPFNIWCGTCSNHIGMGVRYNAEKKKIGAYYSTPIFSFRCKCHLCDGWFEIHTDPKNTRYVVVSGARQKDEDWDPEENGGYAVHDTDKALETPPDALAALEKSTDAQTQLTKVQLPRIESLYEHSEQYNSDPYALSLKVRKRFRAEKKAENDKQSNDDGIRRRYGLPETLSLLEDDNEAKARATFEWKKARQLADGDKRRRLALESGSSLTLQFSSKCSRSTSSGSNAANSLRARLLANTAQRTGSMSNGYTGTSMPGIGLARR